MKRTKWSVYLVMALLLVLWTLISSGRLGAAEQSEGDRLFTLKVLPLLKDKCFGCHGGDPDDIRAQYDMRTRSGLLNGGESEEASIVPGKPADSLLYQAILWDGLEMPPKENDRLTKVETEFVRNWIATGAPWPNEDVQGRIRKHEWSVLENEDGLIVSTSGGLADNWTYRRYQRDAIWGFRQIEKAAVPETRHPVDWFWGRRLQAAGVQPAPQAEPLALIRRAAFDLTGLPPAPQEVTQFLSAWEHDPDRAWGELKLQAGQEQGFKFFVGSPFGFQKPGDAGIEMCDQWKYLSDPEVANELCNFRGCQAESLNHPEALFHMNTGSRLGGDPAIGSWATYGLGSENQNLPGYVVMTELAFPQGGATNWSNGFLPAHYQGTRLRPEGSPLLDLASQPFKSREHQRRTLDEFAFLNRTHLDRIGGKNDALAARMESYELAYRMQMEVPDVINLSQETAQTLDMYGLHDPETQTFGRQCLMARRLVENGVRFVQIFSGGWDSHDYLERGHASRIRSVDKGMAALIKDLKRSGMLEDTLVVWTGEFGRTPDNNKRGGVYSLGRGHNNNAMTMLMAGGGVKPGVVGATDELGAKAVSCVHPIRDFHVTLLHLLGLDDNKLTYFHGGRYKQLSQFGGELIPELIA